MICFLRLVICRKECYTSGKYDVSGESPGTRSGGNSLENMALFDDTMLELLPCGLLALDRELRLRRLNRAACRLLGVEDAQEALGGPVGRVMEEEPFLRLRGGERRELNDCVSLPGGGRWLERSFCCDGARTVYICVLHEVTQQRQQEAIRLEETQRALELAEEIGEKQLRIVHDIAGLLGEAAVETQAALHELKAALLPGGEEKHD